MLPLYFGLMAAASGVGCLVGAVLVSKEVWHLLENEPDRFRRQLAVLSHLDLCFRKTTPTCNFTSSSNSIIGNILRREGTIRFAMSALGY